MNNLLNNVKIETVFTVIITIILFLVMRKVFNYIYVRLFFRSRMKTKENLVNKLMRQTFRWYIAATQDKHPWVKILHSNYANGYLMAMRDVAEDKEIETITQVNMIELNNSISKQQDESLLALAKECPELVPNDPVYKKFLPKLMDMQF